MLQYEILKHFKINNTHIPIFMHTRLLNLPEMSPHVLTELSMHSARRTSQPLVFIQLYQFTIINLFWLRAWVKLHSETIAPLWSLKLPWLSGVWWTINVICVDL